MQEGMVCEPHCQSVETIAREVPALVMFYFAGPMHPQDDSFAFLNPELPVLSPDVLRHSVASRCFGVRGAEDPFDLCNGHLPLDTVQVHPGESIGRRG